MDEPLELSAEKCLELLSGGVFGRVAACTAAGPRIFPVNYSVVDDAVVFRTTPLGSLGTTGWQTELAFEVDHVDHDEERGWSVIAQGRGEVVQDPTEVARIRAVWEPRPWAGGTRHLYVWLRWRELTGRRVGGGWTHEDELPSRRPV
jgi:nitroimidazol reductase NimA-like FMN-containing flavoprotein (pyridoxamine 5'-phosphate oxidase superfamily)